MYNDESRMGTWWIGDLVLICYFETWGLSKLEILVEVFICFVLMCWVDVCDVSVIDVLVDEMSCLWTWTAWTTW